MRVTQWGEFGIHCAAYLAERAKHGDLRVSAPEIAESQGIALQYAQQILQRLRKGAVVESERGPRGGYRLARPADEISLFDILKAAEGSTFEVMCESKPLDEQRCSESTICNLRVFWHEFRESVDSFLRARTLASLLEADSSSSIVPMPSAQADSTIEA